jgi:hypothetical protein
MEINRKLEVEFLLDKIEEVKIQNEKHGGLPFPFLFSKRGKLVKAILIPTKRGPLYTCFAALGEGLNYNGIFFPIDSTELAELGIEIRNVPIFCSIVETNRFTHTNNGEPITIPTVKITPHRTVLEEFFANNNALRVSRRDALKDY